MNVSTFIKGYLVVLALLAGILLVFQNDISVALFAVWLLVAPIAAVDRYLDQRRKNPTRDMIFFGIAMVFIFTLFFIAFPASRNEILPLVIVAIVGYLFVLVVRWIFDWPKIDLPIEEAGSRLREKISHMRLTGKEKQAKTFEDILSGLTAAEAGEARSIASRVMTAKTEEDWTKIHQTVQKKGLNVRVEQAETSEADVIAYLGGHKPASKKLREAIVQYIVAPEHREDFRQALKDSYENLKPTPGTNGNTKSPKVVGSQKGLTT